MSLFGECSYFSLLKIENKEIPSDIVDKGCKEWTTDNNAKILRHIIETFKGEILKDDNRRYRPRERGWNRGFKRKKHKTRVHSHRADWDG